MRYKTILASLLIVSVIETLFTGPCTTYAASLSSGVESGQARILNEGTLAEENSTMEEALAEENGTIEITAQENITEAKIEDNSDEPELVNAVEDGGFDTDKPEQENVSDEISETEKNFAVTENSASEENSAPQETPEVIENSAPQETPEVIEDSVPQEKPKTEENTISRNNSDRETKDKVTSQKSPEPDAGWNATSAQQMPFRESVSADMTDFEMSCKYRFWQVDRVFLFARHYINIQENKQTHAKIVGTVQRADVLFLLKDEGDGWYYIESGKIRGFVRARDVYKGVQAEKLASIICRRDGEDQYRRSNADSTTDTDGDTASDTDIARENFDWSVKEGTAIVDSCENNAFTYYRATVKPTVVENKYAIVQADDYLNIRAGRSTDDTVVGKINNGGLLYVLEDDQNGWAYVESGLVRGFADTRFLDMSDAVQTMVQRKGESTYEHATAIIPPESNKAFYYHLNP